MGGFYFLCNFCLQLFHSKKRYDQKCVLVFMQGTRYSCPILKKYEFSGRIFEKYSNIKFHEIPSSGSRVVQCGQMDRHDEANNLYSQVCERTL
jgi:hypothetical protein